MLHDNCTDQREANTVADTPVPTVLVLMRAKGEGGLAQQIGGDPLTGEERGGARGE